MRTAFTSGSLRPLDLGTRCCARDLSSGMSLMDALMEKGDTSAATATLDRVKNVASAVGLSEMFANQQVLTAPPPVLFGDTMVRRDSN